ncbi:MAG: IclR family transcriptional regulator C-terminal domain-containing protein [Pseudomonadota bacterium]
MSLAKAEASTTGATLNAQQFGAMLDEVTETGLAYDNNDHTDGISAVGFAFADQIGEIHAISVPVPTSRFMRQNAEIEAALRKVMSKVKKAMQMGASE